jgi:hypothetical protein
MKSIAFSVFAMIIAGAAAVPLGPGLGKPDSAPIPMKEHSEFGEVWTKAAARTPDEHKAWKGINNVLEIKAGTLHPSKVERLAGAYTLALSAKSPGTQGMAALVLLEADIPEVTRELLLHPLSDVVAAAARHLAKPAAGEEHKTPGTAPQPAMRDTQAVPFLIYVLDRNNYILNGDEEATVHGLLKLSLVSAILFITDTAAKVRPVDVDSRQDVNRVLAGARAWASEKGLQPLEKQRPPKGEPPTDSKPAPAPPVPPGAKAVGPTDQPAPNPGGPAKSE